MNKSEEIASYILNKIHNQEYKPNQAIPTEVELMGEFGVSKMTVNKALSELRNKDYIYSIRGKGTFVKKRPLKKELNKLTSFTEEMRSRGIDPVTRIIEFTYTFLGYKEEKESLRLKKNDGIYKVIRLRYIKDKPIALDITFLNKAITGDIEINKLNGSLYKILEEDLGISLSYSVQKIKAVKADAFVSQNLKIAENDPVLQISNITYDENEVPIEVVHTYYVHDAYEFEQVCRV